MNKYDRIFGSGPRGFMLSLIILLLTWFLVPMINLPEITANDYFRWTVFIMILIVNAFIIIWSIQSLPLKQRVRKLITTGANKYCRHPLYTAFISVFSLGFAVFLNN